MGWLFRNGTIRTMDRAAPVTDSLAVADGLVRKAGDVRGRRLRELDLEGRCVLPGFTDAHVHFPDWAIGRSRLALAGARSLDETLDLVRAAAAHVRPGSWLSGAGWQLATVGRPSRRDLDRAAGAVPVALWSKDGHAVWLSSAALAKADGDLGPHHVVERDAAGEPTGLLFEQAAARFMVRHVRTSVDEYDRALREAIPIAHARGVTAVHDKDGALGALGLWQRLRRDGALSLRVWQSLPHEELDAIAAIGLRGGLGDEWLRAGYLKVFMDGALGSRTAALLDGSGVVVTTRAELEETVRRGAELGWAVAVHAIGDRANRAALDAFEATREHWASLGLRQRIEHAQLIHPDDLRRFAALGVAASVQFSHAVADRDDVDELWAGTPSLPYPFRSLLATGARVVNGSDAPVEELDPLLGIRAGVARTWDDRPAWRPEEALTVEQALAASTRAAAWLAGDERRRGRLVAGQLADLVILDRDPVSCAPAELDEIRVVATMAGGRWVHGAPPWDQ